MSDINIEDFASYMTDMIREYTEDVSAAIEAEVKSTADLVLAEVKRLAPKHTGDYAKGFTKTDKPLPGNRRYIVWNKEHYRRVHLLEYGHAKVGGGRVRAYPHLDPAHRRYGLTMPDRIKEIIRDGG